MATKKRLIDAIVLTKEIERIYSDHYEMSYDQAVHDLFNAVQRRIRRYTKWIAVPANTVDAVEVVRCKDCKKCTTINNAGEPLLLCEHWKGYPKVDPAGYCYFGERKNNA